MQSSTMDQAEGKFVIIRGKLKEITGELTDNLKTRAGPAGDETT